MACVFACEVETPRKFPGEATVYEPGGRQGNAILSRFPVKKAWPVLITCRKARHSHTSYKTHAEAAAVLETPSGDVLCYSVHLDPHFAGVEGRIAQYFEILDDAPLHYAPRRQHSDEEAEDGTVNGGAAEDGDRAAYAIIAGDFNTGGSTSMALSAKTRRRGSTSRIRSTNATTPRLIGWEACTRRSQARLVPFIGKPGRHRSRGGSIDIMQRSQLDPCGR